MKLTKQQRAVLSRQTKSAAAAVLRNHFTGNGSTSRRVQFLRGALIASAAWMAKFLFIVSWARGAHTQSYR